MPCALAAPAAAKGNYMLDFIRSRSMTLIAISSVAVASALPACSSSEDKSKNGTGGSTGTGGATGGKGGTGGSGGSATGGTAGSGGTTNDAGPDSSSGGSPDSGTGGAGGGTGGATTGPDGGCPSLGALTRPTVDAAIAVPATTTLKARFYAVGYQIYTCKATLVAGDASATTYAWDPKSKPDANLYDTTCSTPAAVHYAGPTWKSVIDGSYVVGTKVGQYQPFVTDSGLDAGLDTSDVLWLKLTGVGQPSPDAAAGLFTDVTYIQRLNTVGGVVPSNSTCTAGNVNNTAAVPYTAVYYFYTGT